MTLNFGELPFQPVHGLSYMGITFAFWLGGSESTDAYYHATGPGTTTYVQAPCLEGDAAGTLMLAFHFPTPILSFGVALNSFSPLSPGFVVTLYDSDMNWMEDDPVSTSPLISFTEGWFNYSGTPVRRAYISFFPEGDGVDRFALDNLTYDTPIPEPATWALLGVGLLGAGILRRRRA